MQSAAKEEEEEEEEMGGAMAVEPALADNSSERAHMHTGQQRHAASDTPRDSSHESSACSMAVDGENEQTSMEDDVTERPKKRYPDREAEHENKRRKR